MSSVDVAITSGEDLSGITAEATHQGFATEQVPVSAQGGGWSVFFIVAGSLAGLPAFVLSTSVFGALGFVRGLEAVLIGTTISAGLGALTASAGSRARAGLAVLADGAFGRGGSVVVKFAIALSLVGWFGVNIGVLGATASGALSRMADLDVPPLAIGLPVCVAIAAVTIIGARGLERLGLVLVPLSLALLVTSVLLVRSRFHEVLAYPGTHTLSFGQAVSAVVGSYVVGIVIQPDYGRFVRRPVAAATGAGLALGVAYPVVLTLSSVASLSLKTPELITAMIILGFGLPALAVLVIGAWIDASACLYSASLSVVNQFPRLRMALAVIGIVFMGVVLVVFGAYSAFIPFLVTLGIGLPPLAAILVFDTFRAAPRADGTELRGHAPIPTVARAAPFAAWIVGTAVGTATSYGLFRLTHLPTLDSILAAVAVCLLLRRASRPGAGRDCGILRD